jgi:hypothetical protein
MKLDKNFYGLAIGAAWTFACTAQAHCNEISINSLRNYFAASSITADPGIMVIVGVGLIALRMLIGKRSKPRAKDSAHT